MKRLMLVITFVLGTLGQGQAQENRGNAKYMLPFCQTWLKLAAERDLEVRGAFSKRKNLFRLTTSGMCADLVVGVAETLRIVELACPPGEDGKSDFDKLHSHAHDQRVFLYAFDLLEWNGEDYRQVSLERRKEKLKKFSRGPRGCDFRSTWTEMARPSFNTPAKWDWKASFRSAIFPIEAADAKAG